MTRPVLGPWVNTFRQNALAWTIVWSLVVLSLMLTAVTFFPNLSTPTLVSGLAIGAVLGILGAAVVFAVGWFTDRRNAETAGQALGVAGPKQRALDELPKVTRAERRATRDEVRANWTMPALATLDPPVMSPVRRAGLLTLRAYLVLACVLVVVKVVQTGIG